MATSLSTPAMMAFCIKARSGSLVSVKIRNKCSCWPGGMAACRVCLWCLHTSTMRRRMRWRFTELLNFFLGTEKPVCTGEASSAIFGSSK